VAGLKGTATSSGVGDWAVFSLKNRIIARYLVEYDAEFDVLRTYPMKVPDSMDDAFALMLEVEQDIPHFFSSGQQSIRGDIDVLGGGPHDPVAVSLNGEHDSAYGSFIYYAQSCLSNVGCASSLSPAVGKLVHADQKLNGLGVSLFGNGVNINWENLPPGVKLWLCDDSNNCALLVYNKDNGMWEYVETRADGGLGKRYPKYNESLNYRFGNSVDAGYFARGLRDGGASIEGTWTLKTVLACTSSGGVTHCEFITYPE